MAEEYIILDEGDSVHQITNKLHVHPQAGDDSNVGSHYFPKRTLFNAVNGALNGTHIIADHGVHTFYGTVTSKEHITLTGEGMPIIQGFPTFSNCEHMWFKDLVFITSASSVGFTGCGDLHFERCAISGEDTIISFQNPTGSIYFEDCDLSCKISVYGDDTPDIGAKVVIRNQKSDKLQVLIFHTNITIHIENSIIKRVENFTNTGKLDPEIIHIDSESHDGQWNDIPITGNVKVIEHETERMRNMYGRHELITSDYVHPASCKNAFYIVDASNGSVTVDLKVDGVTPGSRILLVDTNAGTWDSGSHTVNFRWPNGQGGYNFVRYTTPRDYGEAIFDGTTWRTF